MKLCKDCKHCDMRNYERPMCVRPLISAPNYVTGERSVITVATPAQDERERGFCGAEARKFEPVEAK